jgi:hypothetical protein
VLVEPLSDYVGQEVNELKMVGILLDPLHCVFNREILSIVPDYHLDHLVLVNDFEDELRPKSKNDENFTYSCKKRLKRMPP